MRRRIREPAPSVASSGCMDTVIKRSRRRSRIQRGALVEIRGLEAMLEIHRHAGLPGRDIDEGLIEDVPRDGVNHLVGPLSVRLQRGGALAVMNEPAAHGEKRSLDIMENAGQLQRVNAAVRQREIDGAAGGSGPRGRRGAALIQHHLVSTALQEDGEQRTGGARADDAHHGTIHAHSRKA